MPTAIEQFELKGYDLILSSSHCVAKGIKTDNNSLHICYCHTPMRYIWDLSSQYFSKTNAGPVTRFIFPFVKKYLQNWDVKTSEKVDYFIANSKNVSERIKRIYNRNSVVIYPPVNTNFFEISDSVDDYYLVVSAFAPYKRIDLAIKAFNRLGYPLKIIGSGQCEKQLRKIAGPNIEFLGDIKKEGIKHYYSKCKAFIFPGEEDFGITPIEAMASGRPVIAFGKGGALETVIPLTNENNSPTGLFFEKQTADALVEAVQQFEKIENKFDSKKIRNHTLKFDREVFEKKIREFIDKKITNSANSSP
jgi:glycosyltransferase involved in cell wall biosynthesis